MNDSEDTHAFAGNPTPLTPTQTQEAITAVLSGSATFQEVAEVMVQEGLAALSAQSGVFALMTEETASILVFHTIGLPQEMAHIWSSFLEDLPFSLAGIGMKGKPIWYHHFSEGPSSSAPSAVSHPSEHIFAMLPFALNYGLRGVLGFGFERPRELQEPEFSLLGCLMQAGRQALERHAGQETKRIHTPRNKPAETDPLLGELFLAGEYVLAGIYRQVDSHREILLEEEGYLPASLDGKVACYHRIAGLGGA
ncbi:MAG TPA: hypothetical protein VKU00_13245 [Chthonomonadaceae bacterium]|nr:hypothetical protein [Chthonomonadaceae bacterium]